MKGMGLSTAAIIILMPVSVLFFSFFFNILYTPAYHDHLSGLPTIMEEKSDSIVGYVTWREDQLPKELIDREVDHLADVKGLIGLAWVLFIISSSIIIFSVWRLRKKKGKSANAIMYGSFLSLSLLAVLVFVSYNFQPFFWSFHSLFFSPGSWVFSNTDLLIQLYPSSFFQGFFVSIILNSIAVSVIAMNIALLSRSNRKINFLLQ